MNEYHKIDTVFKRNPATKYKTLLEGEFARSEFQYLASNQWEFTEKVDGTNIRIMFRDGEIDFGGKTDRASIPAPLVNYLKENFDRDSLRRVFDGNACLYGEGYGAGIQKGGTYRPDQSFVLFDVRVGDWWLQRSDVKDVGQKLGLRVVPTYGIGTLEELVIVVRAGFNSEWGDFKAEGIVARPLTELCTRAGHRIITKLKTKDFAVV